MNKIDTAVSLFNEGFSCSQAVFCAFADELGIERSAALKIASAFGGGMAGMGLTCGAVTGAMMVIGAKHGRFRVDDAAAKQKTYEMTKEFFRAFTEQHGSITCRDLLGSDISTPEGKQQAEASGLTKTLCPRLVGDAERIIEGLL